MASYSVGGGEGSFPNRFTQRLDTKEKYHSFKLNSTCFVSLGPI